MKISNLLVIMVLLVGAPSAIKAGRLEDTYEHVVKNSEYYTFGLMLIGVVTGYFVGIDSKEGAVISMASACFGLGMSSNILFNCEKIRLKKNKLNADNVKLTSLAKKDDNFVSVNGNNENDKPDPQYPSDNTCPPVKHDEQKDEPQSEEQYRLDFYI